MRITKDRSELYANMAMSEQEIVDEAFQSAVAKLRYMGAKCNMSDHAENLVGAIARYYRDSGN